jgi:hypothetical protein
MTPPVARSDSSILPRLQSSSSSLLAPYRPKTTGEKRLIAVLLVLSLFVVLAIVVYYFLNPSPTHIIGYQLVNTASGQPLEIPSPSISPIYAKPITYLFSASVVAGYCFFSLGQGIIETRFPRWVRAFFLLLSVLLLAMGLYEVLFNFAFWGAALVNHQDPDTVVNAWPVSTLKTNVTFATKMVVLWAVVAFFSTMTFKKSLDYDVSPPLH